MAKKKSKKEKIVEEVEEVVAETIEIDEEDPAAKAETSDWTEEFVVAGNEIVDFVKNMLHEAGVRRIVIKNEKQGLHWEVPLIFGVAGILALPAVVTMVGVATALLTECSILVERTEPSEKESEAEAAAA